MVLCEGHECGKEISRVRHIRERDHEIALPCRPGGIKDLINLSVAMALLGGSTTIGFRAFFVSVADDLEECVIALCGRSRIP